MSYSKKSIWDTFSCRSITKVRECLCVLKQVLIVNLYNINIQNTIIKGGFQTWSYIKGFSFLIAFLSITHVGFFFNLCNNTAISNSHAYKQRNSSQSHL